MLVSTAQTQQPPYKTPNLSIDERVKDLLARMTLKEKVAQISSLWVLKPQEKDEPGDFSFPVRGKFSAEKARQRMPHGIGHISRQRERTTPRESAEYANAVQKFLIEETRLGIPAILHDEALHGHMALGGTHFPQPIALASSWDTDLVNRIFTASALEARARGGHQVLAPNLDLGREPRWGRTEETYGEDPYLVSKMAVAAVRGFQGDVDRNNPRIGENRVIASAKHFAVHGQPEGGTNAAPTNYSERILREQFFAPFEAAIKEANMQSIMASYNEIDGIPSHANRWLLDDVLRREWGFQGYVVSDYYAIEQMMSRHRIAADKADAARQALAAGVDIELPDPDCNMQLLELAKKDKELEKLIDRAAARVLRAKFQLGLFENPYVDPDKAAKVTNSAEHQRLALEAAHRSIVLLKNEKNTLPLDKAKLKTVAVVGPNAAKLHLGGYSDDPQRGTSILEGIRQKLEPNVKVVYAEGCKITKEGGNWWADKATLTTPEDDAKSIAEAVKVAQTADVIILAIGGNEDTNKEGWSENHLGDRDSLELIGAQNELARAMLATGKPVVAVLINSGPLSINYVAQNVPAILEGFYLGQETGTAVADVIFGDINPAGKLPVSFPRNVGQLPVYYNQKPTSKRGYLFSNINGNDPLFAFGHGLSYTTFGYKNLRVEPQAVKPDGSATVSIDVTNTGNRAGDEIVQLYLRDKVSSVTRPVKELKGFERVSLAAGETKTVRLTLTPKELGFLNREMKFVVEPGDFDVMVGGSQTNTINATLRVVPQ